ncbi:S-formylglutathione hydrolase [Sulfidibacter corallicola]|uniref:S-formylglutathione hydrolase n=1 Tax=Sulfidibacter corallicola TaxID=2818388 RepID=A0A8A4TTW1_SULCO|nr:S-formylglutathione hydrolase [Sulfidibacter corallicola]QTD52807.1 S-formylglutathione hydrolase [Sulfidibacter corallicola]
MTTQLNELNAYKCFDGWCRFFEHDATSTKSKMRFSVYLPPQHEGWQVPVLYWLSGLTCTEENFMIKAGAQRFAAEHGVMLVVPDTSPRGEGVHDEPERYDIGSGAGFYVNATRDPWAPNYRMYDYVVQELPAIIHEHFHALPNASGIFGHSMGGHGALMISLRNPGMFRSVSAFSPISAPSQVPWGQDAFREYLGNDEEAWAQYDTVSLLKKAEKPLPMLIDQGLSDEFLKNLLRVDLLEKVCKERGHQLTLNLHPRYGHSYYFVATFIGEHIAYHAERLRS